MENQKSNNKKRYWIRDIVIKPRTPKWERQFLEKKQAEEYFAIHARERHPIAKKYHKSKHFLKWVIKLIVPDFLIGHPNLWDNLKTLRKHPQFKPLRMALAAWLIFTVTFGALGIYSLNQAVRILAASPVTDTFTDETKIATSTNITVSGGQVKLSVVLDETNPTVSTLSPADDATGVATGSNLVITFDETVDAESGNITIKKSSDDSTVEAINVTGGQVSGSGTDTITIDPSNDLTAQTVYYVQIDATAFDDTSGNSYAGIADTTSWSFSTTAGGMP